VKELCKEFKLKWGPTKNFFIHRLPALFPFYMFQAARLPGGEKPGFAGVIAEAVTFDSLKSLIFFTWTGFFGIGSI
jgi:hypothetical protein